MGRLTVNVSVGNDRVAGALTYLLEPFLRTSLWLNTDAMLSCLLPCVIFFAGLGWAYWVHRVPGKDEAWALVFTYPVNWAWWCMPVIPELRSSRQEDQKFRTTLHNTESPRPFWASLSQTKKTLSSDLQPERGSNLTHIKRNLGFSGH